MTLYLVGGGEERYVVEKRGMTGFIKAIFARFNEPRSLPDDPKETAKLGAITMRSSSCEALGLVSLGICSLVFGWF